MSRRSRNTRPPTSAISISSPAASTPNSTISPRSSRSSKNPTGKDYAFFGPQFTGGAFGVGAGMGLRKSDADLTAKFNTALAAAFADGSVKKYSLKWFKIDTTP